MEIEEKTHPQRLCSEIQLFDICNDDVCTQRVGRYCTKADVLAKFEAIREEDDLSPEMYAAEELDDDVDADDDLEYDEELGATEFGEDDSDEEY